MQFINSASGAYPITFQQLRDAHPLTLFPSDFAEAFGSYAPVQPAQPPAHDSATHKAVELAPVQDGGQWRQAWQIAALTAAELKALVPPKVTRRQARQALLLAGLLDDVQPAIDAIPDPVQRGLAQIEWDDSQEFDRHRPLLIQLAGALGLDGEALDNLFIQAGAL